MSKLFRLENEELISVKTEYLYIRSENKDSSFLSFRDASLGNTKDFFLYIEINNAELNKINLGEDIHVIIEGANGEQWEGVVTTTEPSSLTDEVHQLRWYFNGKPKLREVVS